MICNCCSIDKQVSEFYLHSNGKPRKQCILCHKAKGKLWVQANKDRVNALAKINRDPNKSSFFTQRWRKNNLAYDAYRARTYRARKLQAIPSWANLDKIKEIYLNRPDGMHVDHIVPLKGKYVCGLHVEYNLQYLPAKENLAKRNLYA